MDYVYGKFPESEFVRANICIISGTPESRVHNYNAHSTWYTPNVSESGSQDVAALSLVPLTAPLSLGVRDTVWSRRDLDVFDGTTLREGPSESVLYRLSAKAAAWEHVRTWQQGNTRKRGI